MTARYTGTMGLKLVGFLIVVMLMYAWWWPQTKSPVGIVRDQLYAIEEGLYPQAYNYLSSSARGKLSFTDFVALIGNNSVVRETLDSTFRSREMADQRTTVRGVVKGYGGFHSAPEYVLVKEDGQWKIDHFEWGPGVVKD